TALLRLAGRWAAARQNPPAYTRTVLVNLARDRWRARRHRHRETLVADAARLPLAAARDGAAGVLDRQALLYARRLLPTAPPAVPVLRVWGGPAVEGTGAVVGWPPGARKAHTHLCLPRLRAGVYDVPG